MLIIRRPIVSIHHLVYLFLCLQYFLCFPYGHFLLTVFVLRVLLSSCVNLFILFVFVVPYVYLLYYVCIDILTLDARLLARSQYPEGPATGHLGTGFSWFPCVYKRMLRWFPNIQVIIILIIIIIIIIFINCNWLVTPWQ